MTTPFSPPLTVTAYTDNKTVCELRIAGPDGVAHAIRIPNDGNVYQGCHRIAPQLQTFVNDLLAQHGITAPEPEEAAAEEPELEGETPAETPPDAPPAPKKTAAAKKRAAADKS